MNAQDASDSLKGFVEFDEPQLVLADRSTLERYATCPAQARLVDSGRLNNASAIATAGTELHTALGSAITDYIGRGGMDSPGELVDTALTYLRASRPDVQPDVLRGIRASLWAWAKLIGSMNPANILRYDGGEGERSGQLAWDMPAVGVRVTAELDLLYAGPSKELLHEIDYKSGHKRWTAADVAESFQFQLHGFLVLNNYPDVKALAVRVWNTRLNDLTYTVEISRSDLPAIQGRIAAAAMQFFQYRDSPLDAVPAWPTLEKCSICPAAALCPAAGSPARDVASDPKGFVQSMVAIQARLSAMEAAAKEFVMMRSMDIVCETGEAFGFNKPKSDRKPTAGFYTTKAATNGDDK